jgi:signal transduction histidine kinase
VKISLYQRLSISLVILFIAIAGLFSWWSQNLEQLSRNEAEQRLHISLAEHLAGDNPLLKEGIYDHDSLKNLFHSLMILGPSFEFYFISPAGKILSYSAEPGKVKRTSIDLTPINQLLSNQQSLPIYGEDPRDPEGKKIFSATRIENNNELIGYLYVIIGGEIYDSIFSGIQSNQHLSQSIGLVLGAIVFFFLALLGLLRFLTLPLKELTSNIRAFRQAGFNKSDTNLIEWPSPENNEIHELGQTFNDMAKQINLQLVQLKNSDEQRRELLTHLSHDLRTPLASLQGYLETVELKGNNLSDEQHKRFIGIAFKNANHLKKLVDQIFELAHLEVDQISVNLEEIPLAELLHDIAAKFSNKLEQKKIQFSIEPNETDILINTDIEKLERVITNLIENAIRHTNEGGKIVIGVSKEDGKTIIQVSDNGTGIESNELSRIFEPRYRASNAIDDKSVHSGLGLAISQKLIALLNSEIQVTSELGNGTRFTISMNS